MSLTLQGVSAGSGVTKEGLKGFSLACYEAVSDADLEDETLGVDDSEESTLSGLEEGDNVALIDKSIFSLPKKICEISSFCFLNVSLFVNSVLI